MEEIYLNTIKTIYEKPKANTIFNGEKLKVFPIRFRTKQGCPLLPLLFNIVLEVLARVIRQERERKGIRTGKEKVKLSLFTDDMIIYVENLKELTNRQRHLLEQISGCYKVAGFKVSI